MKRLMALFLFAASCSAQVAINTGVQLGSGTGAYASILSENKNPGVLASSSGKAVALASGATMDLLPTYTGTGYVSEIFFASYGTGGGAYYSDMEIIITVDGEGSPSIDMNAPFLFGSGYACAGNFFGKWRSQNCAANTNDQSAGGVFRLPIPYSSSIHIQVKNNGAGAGNLFYTVANHTGVTNNFTYTQHLRAATVNTAGIAANAETNMINVSPATPGVLAGIFWTYDGVPGSVSPVTAPLEGKFRIYIDGSGTASGTWSGSEDFFGMSGYFYGTTTFGTDATLPPTHTLAPSSSDVVVESMLGSPVGTWAAGRVFASDPIAFTNGLRVSWECGETSAVSFTGTCKLLGSVFYYTQN